MKVIKIHNLQHCKLNWRINGKFQITCNMVNYWTGVFIFLLLYFAFLSRPLCVVVLLVLLLHVCIVFLLYCHPYCCFPFPSTCPLSLLIHHHLNKLGTLVSKSHNLHCEMSSFLTEHVYSMKVRTSHPLGFKSVLFARALIICGVAYIIQILTILLFSCVIIYRPC